jgi:hypothetical protein
LEQQEGGGEEQKRCLFLTSEHADKLIEHTFAVNFNGDLME